MTKRILLIFFSLLLTFVASPVLAITSPLTPSVGNNSSRAPGQILVKFREGTPQYVVDLNLANHNANIKSRLEKLNVLVVNVPQSQEDIIISALSRIPSVEFAEPDFVAHALATTSDPYLSQQWGMFKVQAAASSGPSAWDVTTGSASVKIAILDTGIDQDHPDVSPKIVVNRNFTTSPTVDDKYGHGTHVGGIAAAVTNNSTGVAGLGYNSALMNGKVLDDNGSGYYSWIANGIIWATDNGAKVINMSLGGSRGSSTLANAVNYAVANGVVVVAAAGNSGNSSRTYPAYYSGVIAVAATDSNDAKASWSSYGSWVDVAAPGVNIYSTFPNHPYKINKSLNYDYGSGTSMATPHVAGLAGLVWATGICATNSCVRSQIENNADAISGTGSYWTYGRINAYKSVGGSSLSPSPSPSPSSSPTPTPSPTPSPSPSPSPSSIMHVSDISMWSTGFWRWHNIYTKIIVLDQDNNLLKDANVSLTVTLPSANTASGSGKTGSDGTITFRLRSRETGTYTSNVTNVVKTNYTYDFGSSVTSKSLIVN